MVCEICGAILVQNDAESRVTSHLEGKMHVGYKRIRDYIAKIKVRHVFHCLNTVACTRCHARHGTSPVRLS